MSEDRFRKLKALFEDRLTVTGAATARLKNDLLETTSLRPTILQNGSDHAKEEGDLNQRIEMYELNIVTRDRLQAALFRLFSGSFGRCVSCDEAIGADRLAVHPVAARCIDCQTIEEAVPTIRKPRLAFIQNFWILKEGM